MLKIVKAIKFSYRQFERSGNWWFVMLPVCNWRKYPARMPVTNWRHELPQVTASLKLAVVFLFSKALVPKQKPVFAFTFLFLLIQHLWLL
ncbi:hypothetical protein [Botryobacter ruber]|uniref:hypothetical protein n=1 Tax=Botryobacter ruber TaxID=2171629 RepID=UPI000F65433A|nr:hypothetical protein [Botryobacter ruber]